MKKIALFLLFIPLLCSAIEDIQEDDEGNLSFVEDGVEYLVDYCPFNKEAHHHKSDKGIFYDGHFWVPVMLRHHPACPCHKSAN